MISVVKGYPLTNEKYYMEKTLKAGIILSLLAPFINRQRDIYRWTTILTMIAAFFDFCNALPKSIKETAIIKKKIDFADMYLPGFDYGFGWIVPALGGFIIGFIVWKMRALSKNNNV